MKHEWKVGETLDQATARAAEQIKQELLTPTKAHSTGSGQAEPAQRPEQVEGQTGAEHTQRGSKASLRTRWAKATQDWSCVFILGSPDTPHLCYQCGRTEQEHYQPSAEGRTP